MSTLDLDAIRADAEWSSKRMNTTDVAYRVATVHVPALVAEVERRTDVSILAAAIKAGHEAYWNDDGDPREAITEWEFIAARVADLESSGSPEGASK